VNNPFRILELSNYPDTHELSLLSNDLLDILVFD
jgi:hypothetical protein